MDHGTACRPGDHTADVDTRVSRRRMSVQAPHLLTCGVGPPDSNMIHRREDHHG
jgi:hypothetical protein